MRNVSPLTALRTATLRVPVLGVAWLVVAALVACALASTARAAQDNVLLLVVDDWGADSSALYNHGSSGASLPPTPAIAALAAGGLRFSQAYATPMCSPSRAAISTGRFGFRTGVQQIVSAPADSLQLAEFTLPDAFAAQPSAGYALACFGKWHLNSGQSNLDVTPCTIGGWPLFSGFLAATVGSYTGWPKVVTDGTAAGTTNTFSNTYQTTAVVDDALAWITARDATATPWFAWVAFAAPHFPLHKPPSALCPSYAHLSGTQTDIDAQPRAYYEAAVEALDTEIARLLAGVDRARTNVILVADNGTPNPVLQPPFPAARGKGTLYEGGVRVPLVVNGPAVVAPGRVSDEPVHVVDLYATILDVAGIDRAQVVPANTVLDSRSLAPILANTRSPRTRVFVELAELLDRTQIARALRDERYKLIVFPSGEEELYDLANDPFESVDLIAAGPNGAESARLEQLRTWLASYANGTGVSICSADSATGAQASACPCANTGAVGNGCAHGFDARGANLTATGRAASDDVALHASSLPGAAFTLFLQHDASGDQVFHDGVLCASGALVRLRGRAANAGRAAFPDAVLDSTLTLAQRGGVAAGSGARRYYSAWFRNASTSFCPPATANVTNGWRVDW